MTPLWLLMIAIAQALASLSSPPKSLAAAAEREAMRRQLVGPSIASYSNATLDADLAIASEVPAVGQSRESPAAPEQAPSTRGESWWRERVSAVRAATEREEKEVAVLESEIARLDGQAISRDDPAQQSTLRNQANDTRDELEKRRVRIVSLRRELTALLEEARRLDVPPGWLR